MSEERDPFPTEDPREKGESDQNAEESPSTDAADTSHEDEGDAGEATGNPRSEG
jgi:hypothetical protein